MDAVGLVHPGDVLHVQYALLGHAAGGAGLLPGLEGLGQRVGRRAVHVVHGGGAVEALAAGARIEVHGGLGRALEMVGRVGVRGLLRLLGGRFGGLLRRLLGGFLGGGFGGFLRGLLGGGFGGRDGGGRFGGLVSGLLRGGLGGSLGGLLGRFGLVHELPGGGFGGLLGRLAGDGVGGDFTGLEFAVRVQLALGQRRGVLGLGGLVRQGDVDAALIPGLLGGLVLRRVGGNIGGALRGRFGAGRFRLGRFGLIRRFRGRAVAVQQALYGGAGLSGQLHALVQGVRRLQGRIIPLGLGEVGQPLPGLRGLLDGRVPSHAHVGGGLVQPVVGLVLEGGELGVVHRHGQREHDQEHAQAQRQQRDQQLRAGLQAHLPAPQHHHAQGPQQYAHQQGQENVEEAGRLALGGLAPVVAAIGAVALLRTHHVAAAAPRGKRL